MHRDMLTHSPDSPAMLRGIEPPRVLRRPFGLRLFGLSQAATLSSSRPPGSGPLLRPPLTSVRILSLHGDPGRRQEVNHPVVLIPDDSIHHARPDHGVSLCDGVTARSLCNSLRAKRLAENAVGSVVPKHRARNFERLSGALAGCKRHGFNRESSLISNRTMIGHWVKTLLNMLY
jgi:hypothetical protein